ncbi:MAG: hypothetical protein ACXVA9_02655 [Bdellovibrionales bacterium]
MKSQIIVLTVTAVLAASPAYGAWTDTAPAVTAVSAWKQVKQSVTVAVNYWSNYWGAQPPADGSTAQSATNSSTSGAAPQAASANVTPAANVAPKPTAPAVVSEAAKQLRDQPLYSAKAQNSSLKDVQSMQQKVKATPLLKVAEPGRAGTTKLPKSKAGVPVSNFAQMKLKGVKHIPRLDIGTENLISREEFAVASLHWEVQQPNDFKKLPQPNVVAESEVRPFQKPPVKALGPKGLQANMRTNGHPVTLEQVEKISYTLRDLTEVNEKAYKPLSEEQMKMLAAVILFNKGKHCHMVMGLFHQLQAMEKSKLEATYHLGACAAELKMNQAAFDNLSKVIASEDKDYAQSALTILSKDLAPIFEKDFYKMLKGLKNAKALYTEASQDDISYRAAKGAYRTGDFKTSLVYAEQVGAKSTYKGDAQFLEGMNKFALGDKAGALKKLQDLWAAIGKGGSSNLRALTSVNLARMYFAQHKYDKALEHYMQVPKDHPLWVQALIEQGWTQLASDDFAGAIGNMYSLHSPYFKAVYQPESFVVRTIGYLNICQYGDAYKSLSFIEKDYRDWYGKTSHYLETKTDPMSVYNSVKSYIRGKSTDEVDGVPYQVWREVAHRKDFLNMQTALNDKIDESKRYDGVITKLTEEKASIRWHEEQTKKRFDTLRTNIAKAKVDPVLAKSVDQMKASMKLERDYTIAYRYQLSLLEQSRQGFGGFQTSSQGRIDHESAALAAKTGELLLTHTKHMQKEMSRVLENNEFLRYEVFSGSGENIRYQVAGGQVSGANRIPAHIKPTKMMNWNFDGEFWEDEIGSYRSSLQNNCPKNQQAKKTAPIPSEQARHNDDDDAN